jgi:hypothetical protein
MTQIILDSTQARIVCQAHDQIRVCDPDGKVLRVIAPATNNQLTDSFFTDEEIEEAKRRRDTPGPRFTTKEVLEHLRALRPEVE